MRMNFGKRILSALLTLSMVVGMIPTSVFAAVPSTDADSTAQNVTSIQTYASTLRDGNEVGGKLKDGETERTSYAEGNFTWDSEGKSYSWTYYNGVMLDSFTMLGGSDNYTYVKEFYDDNLDSTGEPLSYTSGEVDSVPMALALFDLLRKAKTVTKAGTYPHNFDESGSTSDVYAITGTIQSNTELTYNGVAIDQGLKMNSQASVSFTTELDGKLTLVFNSKEGGTVDINGTTYTIPQTDEADIYELSIDVTADVGTYTVTKSSGTDGEAYIYYVSLTANDSSDDATFDFALDNDAVTKYTNAIQYVYAQLSQQHIYSDCGGNFLHKQKDTNGTPKDSWSTYNIGLDGLYMANTFLMEYANALDDGIISVPDGYEKTASELSAEIYGDVHKRLLWVADNMYDAETGLYHHGWSVDNSAGNGQFWARGTGWYAMALVDTIEMLPEGWNTAKKDLTERLVKVFDGMLTWQDADTGMWSNVINREEILALNKNKLESSGSAMMAYALMKAYAKGYVNDSKYGIAGLRAFNGTVDNKFVSGSLTDIYKQSGVETVAENYCKHEYVSNEAKGVGPLIMASTWANAASEKLNTSVSTDIKEQVKDSYTTVAVSGSGATGLSVTDLSNDETILSYVGNLLEDGFKAYQVNIENKTNAATISIPMPLGTRADDVIVYSVGANGTLTEVEGSFYTSNFAFKTLEDSGTYVIGKKAVDLSDQEWVYVNKFILTDDMVPGKEYVIKRANSNVYAMWGYTDGTATTDGIVNTNISITGPDSEEVYEISPVSIYNTWYIDSDGRIYAKDENGTPLYMKRVNSGTGFGAETTDAILWDVVTENGAIQLKGSHNDSQYYLYLTSDRTLNHSDSAGALHIYEHLKTQATLVGLTDYTMNIGDGTVNESLIKENATVYYRTSSDEEAVAIPWDEVTCDFSVINYDVVGTYEVPITYAGAVVGTITVNVKESDWVEVPRYYYRVTEMDPNNKDGYIITHYDTSDKTYSLWWKMESGVPTIISSDYTDDTNAQGYTKDEVNNIKANYYLNITETDKSGRFSIVNKTTNEIVLNDQLWYINKDGQIYTLSDGEEYYFTQTESSRTGLVSASSDTDIVTWEIVEANDSEKADCVFLKVSGQEKYLKIGSVSGSQLAGDSSNAQALLAIWERSPITHVKLSGKTSYTINRNDSTVTLESIFEDAHVYALTSNSDMPVEIDWNDEFVSYEWSSTGAFDNSTPGTYVLTVKYAGVEVGKITAVVNDYQWKTDGDATYTWTNTLSTSNKLGYVITNWFCGPTDALMVSDGNVQTNEGIWTDGSTNRTNTIKENISFANIDEKSLWLIEDADTSNSTFYIYNMSVSGTNKYLKATSDGFSLTDKANASVWTISASQHDTENDICLKTSEGIYIGNNGSFGIYTTEAGQTRSSVWSKNSRYCATLDGTLYHEVVVGDSTMNEEYVKKHVSVLYGLSEETAKAVDWNDEYIKIAWTKDGNSITSFNANSVGTYVMTISYKDVELGSVTVDVIQKEIISAKLSGNDPIITSESRTPDLSNLRYTIVYNDGSIETITAADGLYISGYNAHLLDIQQTATVYFGTEAVGTVLITISSDPYAGLDAATAYPEYPEDGAVRIDKFAVNDDGFSFRETGVTQVELDVAGITDSKAVDVILITDVSNSMGWSQDWFNTYDPDTATEANKIDYNEDGTVDYAADDKLDLAMKAATEFAEILLGDNVSQGTYGYENNNTLSFVTFAGHDRNQHDSTDAGYDDYIDSVHTVFKAEESIDNVTTEFANTKFYEKKVSGTSVDYYLQIGTRGNNADAAYKGKNRGNTNYDYAFGEAAYSYDSMIEKIEEAFPDTYEERQTVVLFMTDGAPSHYNDQRANGYSPDYIRGTKIEYPSPDNYSADTDGKVEWTEHISNPNYYAQELAAKADAFYVIGFDLDHGGFKNYAWESGELEPVLWNLAGTHASGETVVDGVGLASDATELTKLYTDLAEQLTNSGEEAKVTDTIKSDFTLQTGAFTYVQEMDNMNPDYVYEDDGSKFMPAIEVTAYDLYTKDETTDLSLIGKRSGTKELIETVTFNEAGTEAYSTTYSKDASGNVIETKSENIMYHNPSDNIVMEIRAEYFTYTKYSDGVEQFVWNIGSITEDELALSYYVYLKNAYYLENAPEDGIYETNEQAILEYIDINGDYAKQEFPIPEVPWGTAITTIEYYLVDEETGAPVNRAGEEVPFENRIIVSAGTYSQKFRWGDTLNVYGGEHVPTGYKMYNQNAYYTVYVDADNETSGSLNITDTKAITAENFTYLGITTQRIDKDTDNYGSTRVAFGVVMTDDAKKVTWSLGKDQIVIDYGKSINVDVFDNNTLVQEDGSVKDQNYEVELVGLAQYDADSKYTEYTQSSPGISVPLETYNGIFSLVGDGRTVQFTPTRIMSEVQKIFTVVKVTNTSSENEDDYYYLYQELDVIPATSVYYETDFASGVFTMVQKGAESDYNAWESISGDEKGTDSGEAADQIQDDGTIGHAGHTYGYDSSYNDDSKLSDGSSYFVEGAGFTATTDENDYIASVSYNTYTTFTFTGTGFDLLSRTGASQGMISVEVYNKGESTPLKKISVINKASTSSGELYQVPVVSVDMDDFGTYDVKIVVFDAVEYENFPSMNRGNEFYFDAIRVYNPMDEGDTTDAEALEAYKADGEAYATVQEVREMLIKADKFDITGSTGAVFVDGIQVEDGDTVTIEQTVENITDYDKLGPNNEVYLDTDQMIAFALTIEDAGKLASIDLGVKATGVEAIKTDATETGETETDETDAAAMKVWVSATAAVDNNPYTLEDITSSTTQYIDLIGNAASDINNTGTVYVLVQSTGSRVLSITDIKVAYNDKPEPALSAAMVVNEDTMAFVAANLSAEPDLSVQSAESQEETYKIFSNAEFTVETSQYVERLEVSGRFGMPVKATATYADQNDGTRVWSVKVLMNRTGEQMLTITGYGAESESGESAQLKVNVSVKKGGGWQDEKNIFKTLFSNRIFSVERGSGSQLFR